RSTAMLPPPTARPSGWCAGTGTRSSGWPTPSPSAAGVPAGRARASSPAEGDRRLPRSGLRWRQLRATIHSRSVTPLRLTIGRPCTSPKYRNSSRRDERAPGGSTPRRAPTGSIETWRETTGYPTRMSVDPAFLAKISLFAPLDDDERGVLAQAMGDRQVKPGEGLFRAGHRGDSVVLLG